MCTRFCRQPKLRGRLLGPALKLLGRCVLDQGHSSVLAVQEGVAVHAGFEMIDQTALTRPNPTQPSTPSGRRLKSEEAAALADHMYAPDRCGSC